MRPDASMYASFEMLMYAVCGAFVFAVMLMRAPTILLEPLMTMLLLLFVMTFALGLTRIVSVIWPSGMELA